MASPAAKTAHPPIVVCDIEMTAHGRDRNLSKVFAVTLVLLHPDKHSQPIPDEDKLVVYIDHEGIQNLKHPMWMELKDKEFWNAPPQAAMRKFLLEKVQSEGMDPKYAFEKIWQWLREKVKVYPDLTLMDDGGADWDLLNHCLAKYDAGLTVQYVRFTEYKPYFDFNSYCKGLARTAWNRPWWGNEGDALRALGLEKPDWGVPHDHHPLHDAELSARTCGFVIQHLISTPPIPPSAAAAAASAPVGTKRKTPSEETEFVPETGNHCDVCNKDRPSIEDLYGNLTCDECSRTCHRCDPEDAVKSTELPFVGYRERVCKECIEFTIQANTQAEAEVLASLDPTKLHSYYASMYENFHERRDARELALAAFRVDKAHVTPIPGRLHRFSAQALKTVAEQLRTQINDTQEEYNLHLARFDRNINRAQRRASKKARKEESHAAASAAE